MNISQHLFMPQGQCYPNKYYTQNGIFTNVNAQSTGKVASFMFTKLPVDCNMLVVFNYPTEVGATQSAAKTRTDGSVFNVANSIAMQYNGYPLLSDFDEFTSVTSIPNLYQGYCMALKVPVDGVALNLNITPIDTELI